MRWGRRFEEDDDEVPEEIRGKSPKQVAEELRKAKELQAKNSEAEEARLASEKIAADARTEIDAMKAKIAEMEARGQNKTPAELEAERLAAEEAAREVSPWVDPAKFVADQTKGVTDLALTSGMMTAKMYFTQNLDPRDAKIFKKYEKEVDGTVSTFAPVQRVMPQSWFNAFLYVKGVHESEIAKAESSKTEFFAEVPSRGVSEEPPPQDTLTDEEKAVCKKMHWSEEGYLKQKKQMTIHSSNKGAYARFGVPERTQP